MAELDFSPNMYFTPPNSAGYSNGIQMGVCNGLTFFVSHAYGGSWGAHYIGASASTSHPNIPYNPWIDLAIGNACFSSDQNIDDDVNLKMINLNVEKDKDNPAYLGCFDNNEKSYELVTYVEDSSLRNTNEVLNARQNFVNSNKKIEETGPFAIAGYFPLYDTIEGAIFAAPKLLENREGENTLGYHIHEFNGVEYYMPNGLELGVTQFHGDYVVEQQRQIAPALCSFDDIKKAAGAIMYPVYVTSPQAMNIWYNNFITFQQNMWTHFQNAGCNWWVNRINLWTSQLPSITNAYQLSLKTAKIAFAYQMNAVCGCPPIPPLAPPSPVSKVAETIEEVEVIQEQQDIQPVEPVYTPPPQITPPEEDEEPPPTYTPPSSGGY